MSYPHLPKHRRFKPCHRTFLASVAVFACFNATAALAQANTDRQEAAPPNAVADNLAIEDLFKLTVSAATRQPQTVDDAPAAVTVVTAEDIRKYGYRTLGDLLAAIKGTYINKDRTYQYFGYRGFARSGDYNSRILLLVDGNRVNDNVYEQAFIGVEFPLEIESVERVEFVPGSASALYGNNAFFGVINVITRHETSKPGTLAVVKADNQNHWSVWGGHTGNIGQAGRFSLDIARRGGAGPSLYYPAFDAPATNFGRENGAESGETRRLWAKLSLAGFSTSLIHSDRTAGLPGAPFAVTFNDPASFFRDVLTTLDASKSISLTPSLDATLRGFWGTYKFDGAYAFPDAALNRDVAQGAWHGAETRIIWRGLKSHTVMAGFDYQRDSKLLQRNFDVEPDALYLDDRRSRSRFALNLQDEWRLGPSILTLGVRHDRRSDASPSTNPRLSWVLPIAGGYVFKSVYGTAFRAPNAYERYYYYPVGDLPVKLNADLKPERIRNLDLVLERSYGDWRAGLNAYAYRMSNLIQQVVDPADGNLIYSNIASVHGRGMDAEIKYRWANGADFQLSVSLQRTREGQSGERSVNSPSRLAKLRFSLPLSSSGVTVAFDMQGISRRMGDSGAVPGNGSANLVLSGIHPAKRLELGAGIFNLFNATVLHPVSSAVYTFNAMQQETRHVQVWMRCQL